MRLETLCRISMRYADASWHRPYGDRGASEEALGFGHGDGSVSGEIEGGLGFGEKRDPAVKVGWTGDPSQRMITLRAT